VAQEDQPSNSGSNQVAAKKPSLARARDGFLF
jgi:hypothetical protein